LFVFCDYSVMFLLAGPTTRAYNIMSKYLEGRIAGPESRIRNVVRKINKRTKFEVVGSRMVWSTVVPFP
jgi:hypothetical protein